jgi:hypothetical protein
MSKQIVRQTLALLVVLTFAASVKPVTAQTVSHISMNAAGPQGGGGGGQSWNCDPVIDCVVAVQ